MKKIHVLLVEDNEGDIVLTEEAFRGSELINKITAIRNGKEALIFLHQALADANGQLPDLILLDINLPLKSGHEVLQKIKETEYLREIPVIMLTTSSSKEDISLSYKHHANCYITKPMEVDQFFEALASVEQFWFKVVKLPSKN